MTHRILTVEDSATQAAAIRHVLESAGFEVEVARDGEAGLAAFDAERHDAVVSDIVMPGTIDGYELCRRIKKSQSGGGTPVMLLTSLASPMDIIHGLACGADNFLTKPYDPEHLVHRLEVLLRTRAARRSSKLRMGVDVYFMGQSITVTSDREQILDLLISTFEDAVRQNQALRAREEELRAARVELSRYAESLEARLEQVLRSVPDVLFSMVPDLSAVTYTSPAAMDVTGFAPEGFTVDAGLWWRIVDPDDSVLVRSAFERAGRGERANVRFRMHRPDGGVRTLDASIVPVRNGDGSVERIDGIARDVTEARQLEDQLRQAQKMEMVGQLAGGVAHDFNNLLCVILGWTAILLGETSPESSSYEALEEIHNAGEAASNLTKQLLAFSRKQIVQPVIVNPNDVVASSEKMLRRLIGEHIAWTAQPASDAGSVKIDRGQLEQVLMNLVVNARDAMPQGGSIAVETANMMVGDAEAGPGAAGVAAGEYVVMTVRDTGMGMSEAVRARIFEPFFTTKASDKGTGLGLATCFGIVRQAGGSIVVQSEEGAGTSMHVYLPRSDAEAAVRPRQDRVAPQGSAAVLLVEDDAAVHRVTERMLAAQGYRVVSAHSAADALRIVESAAEPIDLMLTDVVLAGEMSGAVLAERVRKINPSLRILFASGYTSDVAAVHGLLEEGAALAHKPFTAESLGAKIREVLATSS